jgi:hypothetical protein
MLFLKEEKISNDILAMMKSLESHEYACFIFTVHLLSEGIDPYRSSFMYGGVNLLGHDGNPRQSRIFLIAPGGLMPHKILIRPPQESHFKTSSPNNSFSQLRSTIFPWMSFA